MDKSLRPFGACRRSICPSHSRRVSFPANGSSSNSFRSRVAPTRWSPHSIGGAVDVTQTATPYLIRAVLAGSDAVAIAGETANPIYSLVVQAGIRSFCALRGEVLGLSWPVDTISISMRKLLALKGLGEADYSVKVLVGTPVRFDCLKRGECDAVPLGQPEDFLAVGQGFRRIGLSTEAVGSFQFQVVAARRAWAQANKEAVVRFVRALAAAFRFI